jgi:hypothetical protein
MRRAWIAVLAMAVLALPGAALAHDGDRSESGDKNRSKACKALRAQMGHNLFRETFGTRHHRRNAHGKCVSGHRRVFRSLVKQAVADCRAQFQAAKSLRHGGRMFGDDDRNGTRRAFRRCVKEKLRAAVDAAVTACRTERMADVAAFKEKYGRGKLDRHAFFRCVVQTLRANQVARTSV